MEQLFKSLLGHSRKKAVVAVLFAGLSLLILLISFQMNFQGLSEGSAQLWSLGQQDVLDQAVRFGI
ncbi:MAG: hypothetical protein Q8O95_03775 [bacterium]|nr:hypothetical protein [bacterium]